MKRSCRAPTFPTGGFILGRQGILDAFRTGRGSLRIRAKAAIEPMGKDREHIIVTEIPYQVNKSRLIENAAALVNEKKIEGISEIRDESDRDGMRIVFELKRGEQAEVILNNLYKNTQLQISFGIINLSIVNGQPRELGLISTIKYFIEHRVDVVRRRTDFELRKAREREHILLGFRMALDNIDEVIRLIRAAKSPQRSARVAGCGIDAVQVQRRLSQSGGRRRASAAAFREAGAGHHRAAIAAPDGHGAGEDRERAGRYSAAHWRISGDPRIGKGSARSDHQGTAGKSRRNTATSAARRSSTIRARSGWKIWSRWKTWR